MSPSQSIPSSSLAGFGRLPSACDKTGKSGERRPSFKQRNSIELREAEIKNIRKNYPLKIPVIVEKYHKEVSLPALERDKYLVPCEITLSQFLSIIRSRMHLQSTQSLYLIINNKSMANLSMTIAEIYRSEKDRDGFLYMVYASQEMFG